MEKNLQDLEYRRILKIRNGEESKRFRTEKNLEDWENNRIMKIRSVEES